MPKKAPHGASNCQLYADCLLFLYTLFSEPRADCCQSLLPESVCYRACALIQRQQNSDVMQRIKRSAK